MNHIATWWLTCGLALLAFGPALGDEPPKGAPAPKREKVPPPPPPPPPDEPPPADGGPLAFQYTTDEAIAFFQARVAKNPQDYYSFRYLGEMYERKARESGDHAAFAPAEEALRKALAIEPRYARARASLAAVLCARHKFAEALKIAEELVQERPDDIDALATRGDALAELGRYDEAATIYDRLAKLAPIPEVQARLAGLAELQGREDEAESLLRKAAAAAEKAGGPKAAGWYRWRLGELAFAAGRLEEAASLYQSVPEGIDAVHDATAGLARVRAAQGKTDEAIALYRKAIAIGPDAAMLAALGDLLARAGRTAEAAPLFEQVVSQTRDAPEHRRTLAVFLADNDRDLPRALGLMRQDYAERQDLHGRDAMAWVLFKNGQAAEAAPIIESALKLGTRDARVQYHAGLIFRASGDRARAREHLRRALEREAALGPGEAETARTALDELGPAP
jgi:tetratricopeptide (TPR) repeat protein